MCLIDDMLEKDYYMFSSSWNTSNIWIQSDTEEGVIGLYCLCELIDESHRLLVNAVEGMICVHSCCDATVSYDPFTDGCTYSCARE